VENGSDDDVSTAYPQVGHVLGNDGESAAGIPFFKRHAEAAVYDRRMHLPISAALAKFFRRSSSADAATIVDSS
jgi:hypothetical protein